MSSDPTLEQIAELMDELYAYHHRVVVIKVGGNSIAEDEHFIAKIAKQVKYLRQNGVRVVLIHGGGPQIDEALRIKNITTVKGSDGRRITTPAAIRVVHQVMNKMNRMVVSALIHEGCSQDKVISAASTPFSFVEAGPIDSKNPDNRSGKPSKVHTKEILKALDDSKIVVLHSMGLGRDGRSYYNINGDDYAMAVAIALKAKRLILVTNVEGVLNEKRHRIPVIDQAMAKELIERGTVHGGMIPKVESALWVVKQGVGGVAIIDGHRSWAILAELLTRDGFGTLFLNQLG